MKRPALSLIIFAVMVSPLLHSAPAHAQVNQAYVNAVTGSDTGNCSSPTAPCASFAYALSQTASGGEINCQNSGNFGSLGGGITIAKSITIDCHDVLASMFASGGNNAITINAGTGAVVLRNLTLDGLGFTSGTPGNTGIVIQTANRVIIEDCVIENFSTAGIKDARSPGGGILVVRNSTVRDNGGTGIAVAQAAPGGYVTIEDVRSISNNFGVAAGPGNDVLVSHSIMSHNLTAGVEADTGSSVLVDNTEINGNGNTGVMPLGMIALANSDIAFNVGTGISGATYSYDNNRIFGNGSAGTTPTLISPGQQ